MGLIKLQVWDYNAPYDGNNGDHELNINQIDIALAFLKIGIDKTTKTHPRVNEYRILEIYSRAMAYLEMLNTGHFVFNDEFRRLEKSEAATVSYFLGQALTAIYAERRLKSTFVVHVGKNELNVKRSSGTINLKATIPAEHQIGSGPDLIGIEDSTKFHVLEAKCHQQFQMATFNKAIYQVSCINTINGKTPMTKSVCYFTSYKSGILGKIKDPDERTTNVVEIQFDESKLFRTYYNPFIQFFSRDNIDFSFPRFKLQLETMDYLLIALSPNIFWGIQSNLLSFLTSASQQEINCDSVRNLIVSTDKVNQSLLNLGYSKYEFALSKDGTLLIHFRERMRHFHKHYFLDIYPFFPIRPV